MELRPWTLPNFLTFARLAALPFLVMAILGGRPWAALVIFLAAAVTDIVDGYVARRFGMGSPLGAWLDPIADKLFLVSTFVVFALPSTPTSVRIPMWLLVLTIFRDVYILVTCLVLFLALGIRSFPPSLLGKLTTFLEISTVTAILLVNVHRLQTVVATVCMWLVAAFATVSALHYTWRVLTGLPRGPHPPAAAPAA
ncbi:MAG TPA: CDP-alcohol phosphatidyltransferase family protein [Thermoanaerobaculia bacterium]|nr:CDP-alcohol phosphatidyltransferase family protein [Thermoanaerobaculia bacterium]